MDTTFMNLENRKTSDPHMVTLNLTVKINLKRSDKYVSLSNLRNYSAWKNIKASYKNKFKISASMGSDKFELPDDSYSVSDIQDYFDYINKKHKTLTKNPPIRIYVNEIEKRITFEINTGYYLEIMYHIWKLLK